MKRFLYGSKSKGLASFTLVELLVVIAIIAILASVLLAVGNSAIKTAKRAKAYNTATGIQTAATSYYTEYSVYPAPSGTVADYAITDTASDVNKWRGLIESLSGNIKPSLGTVATSATEGAYTNNTRGIAFLSMRSSDVDASDAPLNPIPSGANSVNIYFNIAFDTDYDGTIGATGTFAGTLPKFSGTTVTSGGTSTAGVMVWANCNGPSGNQPNAYVKTY